LHKRIQFPLFAPFFAGWGWVFESILDFFAVKLYVGLLTAEMETGNEG
jgi:hypothetical protein